MRELANGIERLFDVGDAPVTSEGYSHSAPWKPPERRDEKVELDAEPPEEDHEDDASPPPDLQEAAYAAASLD
jgi:hypothetical protein